MTWFPSCMDAAEFELWLATNRALSPHTRAERPCADCPAEWLAQMREQGSCNGNPVGRPRTANHSAARREKWAANSRAYRARAKEQAA